MLVTALLKNSGSCQNFQVSFTSMVLWIQIFIFTVFTYSVLYFNLQVGGCRTALYVTSLLSLKILIFNDASTLTFVHSAFRRVLLTCRLFSILYVYLSLLFADDMVLLASSNSDLQLNKVLTLGRIGHRCELPFFVLFSQSYIQWCGQIQLFFAAVSFIFSETCAFFCCFSPGRSPISFDHEIVMMNHVYKERFPKVSNVELHFLYRTCSLCFVKLITSFEVKNQLGSLLIIKIQGLNLQICKEKHWNSLTRNQKLEILKDLNFQN